MSFIDEDVVGLVINVAANKVFVLFAIIASSRGAEDAGSIAFVAATRAKFAN